MRKILNFITIALFLIMSLPIHSKDSPCKSGFALKNPPNTSVYWSFGGNQIIWVTYSNCNTLGVGIQVKCENLINVCQNYALPPFATTNEIEYSQFGRTPINWRFTITTISSAALVVGNAHWAPFEN